MFQQSELTELTHKSNPVGAIAKDEILLICKVRNEALYLPYFLEYYRGKGVDRFFFVDNASTDDTARFLCGQADVHVFHTDDSFRANFQGIAWLNEIGRRFAIGHWCLTLDADEILCYPWEQYTDIRQLTKYLDHRGYAGLFSIMIDMYGEDPVNSPSYVKGVPFADYAPYFDQAPYFASTDPVFPPVAVTGGLRHTHFNTDLWQIPVLRKVPLIKWCEGSRYYSATHTLPPLNLADITAVILHYKYLKNFTEYCASELERGDGVRSRHLEAYNSVLGRAGSHSFFTSQSTRFEGSSQLIRLGLMRATSHYLRLRYADTDTKSDSLVEEYRSLIGHCAERKAVAWKDALALWDVITAARIPEQNFHVSVIIAAYNAAEFLNHAALSALAQPETAELILVEDGSTDKTLKICEDLTNNDARVKLYRHRFGVHRGMGASRNLGIRQARFPYIAFLDADGYYLNFRFRRAKRILLGNPRCDGVYEAAGVYRETGATDNDWFYRMGYHDYEGRELVTVARSIAPRKLFKSMHPLGDQGAFHLNALTVRKDLFQKTGYFVAPPASCEVDMCMKMALAGHLVGVSLNQPSVIVRSDERELFAPRNDHDMRARLRSVLKVGLKSQVNAKKLSWIARQYAGVHRGRQRHYRFLQVYHFAGLVLLHPRLLVVLRKRIIRQIRRRSAMLINGWQRP